MRYLIIGGTGTLGTALAGRLYHSGNELIIFSRDELKQSQMRQNYPDARFVLGDIRDPRSINGIMKNVDTVFHVAALKHVDSGEQNPVEFIKTNLLGTVNVAEAAIAYDVPHVVFSSTDKAVLPINTYGMTKGLSERYLLHLNRVPSKTTFAVYRWGNVLGSRGSVVHTFSESLKNEGGVKITDPRMTRFWIHIDEAVAFMLDSYHAASRDRVMIPPMKSASVIDLAKTLAKILGINKLNMGMVGMRPGEKIHECLESNHDYCRRSDNSDTYTGAELEELLRKVVTAC